MLDPVIPDLLGALYDALLDIPGMRFLMGLASPNWRPLWAITWLVAIVYVVVRTLESLQRRGLYRRLARPPAAASPPVTAWPPSTRPTVAPPLAERPGATTPAEGLAASEVGPYTPDPEPGPTMAELVQRTWPKPPSRAARAALGAAALGAALALLSLFRGGDAEAGAADGALAVDTSFAPDMSTDAPPFTFAARGWRQAGGACVATLEVTGAAQPAGPLTMFVMDAAGTVLGTAALRVPVLVTGAFHEFRFPGVDCDAVTQWQVQG